MESLVANVAEGSPDWRVALTGRSSRSTLAAMRELEQIGLEAYTPTWYSRAKQRHIAWFVGYVFFRGIFQPVLHSQTLLAFGNRIARVSQFEIDAMRTAVNAAQPPDRPIVLKPRTLRTHRASAVQPPALLQ